MGFERKGLSRPAAWGALLIAAVTFLALPATSPGIVIIPGFDDNPAGLDHPPDSVVGKWGTSGSAVAVSPNFVITTAHQSYSPGTTAEFGGKSYLIADVYQASTADLRVARLEDLSGGPANLSSYVSLYNPAVDGSEVGKTAVLGGFGLGRGAPVIDSVLGTTLGYTWADGSGGVLRWGANRVDSAQTSFYGAFPLVSDILMDDFDPPGAPTTVPYEGSLAIYDSGGGWFIKVGNQWKVAGLNAYTTRLGQSGTGGFDSVKGFLAAPDENRAIRVGSYLDFIDSHAPAVPQATVLGRYMFYNNSKFDGNTAGVTPADRLAIAVDKRALLPGGTATFANYSSFSRGINGIIIDVDHLAGIPSAADFIFKVGNSDDLSTWDLLGDQPQISVLKGGGQRGTDRITLVWPDGAVAKEWLQVTVNATAATGLLAPDVFYFGNAIGEAGNSPSNTFVNATDQVLDRLNPRTFLNPAPIDFRFDFNRDGLVTAVDEIIARNNATTFLTSLQLIHAPSPPVSSAIENYFIPEPSSIVLAGLALVGFIARALRCRAARSR